MLDQAAAQDSVKPQFEAASVKLNHSGLQGGGIRVTPGRIEGTNATVDQYICAAFGLRSYQLEGLPAWAKTSRYDVVAKMADGEERGKTNADQSKALSVRLLALIEERFQLEFHRENKALPAYDLMVAKNGLKLTPADPNEPHPGTLAQGAGSSMSTKRINGKFVNQYWNYTMSQLVYTLTSLFNKDVVDRTGIQGRYNYTLVMSIDAGTAAAGDSNAESGESVFTSLQDMGLKLESAKVEKEMFVVDRIEKPADN